MSTPAELFDPARDFLREHIYAASTSDYNKRYRYEHCLRVAGIGRSVAKAEGLDADLLSLGCLLHDIGKFDSEVPVDHGRAGALVVVPFLRENGLPEPMVTEVALGIAMHVDGLWNIRTTVRSADGSPQNKAGQCYFDFATDFGFTAEPSILAQSISDCDNIDRFGAYRVADTLHYFSFMTEPHAKQREIAAKLKNIEHLYDYECATDTAQDLWIDRLDSYCEFFTRLHAELS